MINILRFFLISCLIATAFIVGLGLVFILTFIGCSILFISTFIGYFDRFKKKNNNDKNDNVIDAEYEIIDKDK